MTIQTNINPENGVVRHIAEGAFSFEEALNAYDNLSKHPEYKTGFDVIWDFTGLDFGEFDSNEIFDIANSVKSKLSDRSTNYKAAFLVNDDLAFGLTNMFKSFSLDMPLKVGVFRSIKEIYDWFEK